MLLENNKEIEAEKDRKIRGNINEGDTNLEDRIQDGETIRLGDVMLALKEGVPLGVSVGIYGLVLGVLGKQLGLNWLQMFLMSTIVLAGSAQFVALPMIAANVNPFIIILTTFIVNLRHALMSISLIPYFKDTPNKTLALLTYGLTDESYAQFMGKTEGKTSGYFLGAGLNVWLYWNFTTILGILIGGIIDDPIKYGFDFAFIAVFIGLIANQLKERLLIIAAIISVILSLIFSYLIPGKWYIIIASILASIIGTIIEIRGEKDGRH